MAPQTYIIGIAGPSGAGKSYLAQHLSQRLRAPVLALDHYYRDLSHLVPEVRTLTNFDEPLAIEHELLIGQVKQLRDGKSIAVPTYDFSVHTRTSATWPLGPSTFMILEGLFALYWPELRQLMSTTVYVDLEESLCLQRRLERDVHERGRTPESVLSQYHSMVAPMAEQFVKPTSQQADVLISGSGSIDECVSHVLDHVQQQARRNHLQAALDQLAATESAPVR